MGVNSTVANNVVIAKDCLIGMGAVINRSTEEDCIYKGNINIASDKSAKKLFKVDD